MHQQINNWCDMSRDVVARFGWRLPLILWLATWSPTVWAQTAPSVSPSSLRFSSVGTETGGVEKAIRVTNKGAVDLQITLVRREGADREDFSQSNTCGLPLAPKGSCLVTVRFAPETAGTKQATLVLESTAGSVSVPLVGVAAGPRLKMSPRAVKFSKTNVGSESPAKFFTIRNSGKGVLQIQSLQSTGPQGSEFALSHDCVRALERGASCRGEVRLTPGASGIREGGIEILANEGRFVLGLSGTGYAAEPKLALSPSRKLSFSSQGTEIESAPKRIRVINRGAAPLRVISLQRSGSDQEAFAQTNTCGGEIAPREECEIAVTFTPQEARDHLAALTIRSNAGDLVLELAGKGAGPKLKLSPSRVSFPEQSVGLNSAGQRIVAKNTGKGLMQVESISLGSPHGEDFSYLSNCNTPIAPGEECEIDLIFSPSQEGSRQTLLTVAGNMPPQSLRVTGTAGPPPSASKLTINSNEILVRAGQSVTVPFTAFTEDGLTISLPRVSWSSSDPMVASVSESGVVTALAYEGFEVKVATISVTAGSATASVVLRVTPDSNFRGYRVSDMARTLGNSYWENTPVPLDLILRIFLTRQKNHPQQYSGWSGALTAGDFDGDGFIDVFTAGSACAGMQSRPTFLIWNPSTWRFDEKNLFNDGTDYLGGPMGVAPVYLNDDNYVDLVIIGHSDECARPYLPNEPVRIALSDGKGGYDLHVLSLQSEELLRRFGQELGDVGDVTGDGLPDLLISANSHAYIFRGIATFPYFTAENFSHFASDTINFPDAQNGFGERVPNAAEFAFGGKILDFDDDSRNDFIMLTTEDLAAPRQARIFFNQGAGRFTADQFENLPFFYDEQSPPPMERVAHLMDVQRSDVNQDGFGDLVGVNQESYQKWNLIYYRAEANSGYVIDRDAVKYLDPSADRPQYKATLIKADFDGDGVMDFGYNSFGSAYSNLAKKSVFLNRDGKLVEHSIRDIDPYAKWLLTKIIPYGCPYECVD